jgi:O-antigen/teichoic acid export membrane protein
MQIRQLLKSDLAQKLLGPGLWALIIKVGGAALSYIMFVAFAHFLTPKEYGYFGVAFNLSILAATLCSFGLSTGIMRFWPEYLAQENTGLAKGIVHNALKLLGFGAVAFAIFALILSVTGVTTKTLGYADAPLAIAALAIGSAFADFSASLLRAQGKVIWAMFPRDILWRIAAPLAAFIFIYFSKPLDARTSLYVCGAVLFIIVAAQTFKINSVTKTLAPSSLVSSDWPKWRSTLGPLWASSILYAMIQQLDVVMVGTLANATDAASYFAAQKTASLLGLVMMAGGLVGAPLMSANYHSGKLRELQRLCSALSIAIAIFTLLGVLVLFIFGRELLGIFDQSFISAYPVLLLLAAGFTIDSLAGPNAYLMQMTGLERPYLKIMASCYVVVLILQVLLIPIYGGIGAAAASAIGIISWNICAITLLRKSKGLDPSILGLVFKPKFG